MTSLASSGLYLVAAREVGNPVDALSVMAYRLLSAAVCAAVWMHESRVVRRTGSQIIRNDAREWMVSMVTLIAFAMVWVQPEPAHGWWVRYGDSAVLSLLALLLIPGPASMLVANLRALLLITGP